MQMELSTDKFQELKSHQLHQIDGGGFWNVVVGVGQVFAGTAMVVVGVSKAIAAPIIAPKAIAGTALNGVIRISKGFGHVVNGSNRLM